MQQQKQDSLKDAALFFFVSMKIGLILTKTMEMR